MVTLQSVRSAGTYSSPRLSLPVYVGRRVAHCQRRGGGVVFDTNELLQLCAPLRVVRYEDTNAVGDFGQFDTRVVRVAAVKP